MTGGAYNDRHCHPEGESKYVILSVSEGSSLKGGNNETI